MTTGEQRKKRRKPRWFRGLVLGTMLGVVLAIGAYLLIVGTDPFASAWNRVTSTAVELRWRKFPPTRIKSTGLVELRDRALETAFRHEDRWLYIRRGDSPVPIVYDEIYPRTVPDLETVVFALTTDEEVQSRADASGVYWCYHVGPPRFSWRTARVWVSYQQHFARGSDLLDLGSRAVELKCRRASGEWRCNVLRSVLS